MRSKARDSRQKGHGRELSGASMPVGKSQNPASREERLAAALRANLRRRKQQARGRGGTGEG